MDMTAYMELQLEQFVFALIYYNIYFQEFSLYWQN